MLQERVQGIVDMYWHGNVKAAAEQLGIPQNNLYRIVSGETLNPRADVLAKIARFAGTTVEYLLTGEGAGPRTDDEKKRRRTGASERWWRLVEQLFPYRGGVREHLDDVPFALNGLAMVLLKSGDARRSSGKDRPRPVLDWSVYEAQDNCLIQWTNLLEAAIASRGADAVRNALESSEVFVAFGCSPFVGFLISSGAMTKAQANKYLAAWEDELTRDE